MSSEATSLPPTRVIVAMSGGVDSSVAAARLQRLGHEVVGVTLHLWDYPDDGSVRGRCCAPEDQHDARRVADHLGIAHFSFDRREQFKHQVIDPFVDAYLAGETPSPCVACNRGVKMLELFEIADHLGASHVATGHYARVGRDDRSAALVLMRGRDPSKDQSYFLHSLTQAQLSRVIFPLGDSVKAEVRAEASSLALPGAAKGESQELCFVPTGRYDAFVDQRAAGRIRPGPIIDAHGREIGRHEGIHRFTVGQRKGLGVAVGERAYVASVDASSGAVRLGTRQSLDVTSIIGERASLSPVVGDEFDAIIQVRSRHEGSPGRVRRLPNGRVSVRFVDPVSAVTVGQYAVFYVNDWVVGGAEIREVERPWASSLGAPSPPSSRPSAQARSAAAASARATDASPATTCGRAAASRARST